MSKSKTIFLNERERQANMARRVYEEADAFFGTSNVITINIRSRYQIDAKVAESTPISLLKKDIRRRMLSDFRKALTKELNDQL